MGYLCELCCTTVLYAIYLRNVLSLGNDFQYVYDPVVFYRQVQLAGQETE